MSMHVVDFQPRGWFLLEDDGDLYLDGHYSQNFVGYEFLMQLNCSERERYSTGGRAYLDYLTSRIQESVPIASDTTSPYVDRRVDSARGKEIAEAVIAWKQLRGE